MNIRGQVCVVDAVSAREARQPISATSLSQGAIGIRSGGVERILVTSFLQLDTRRQLKSHLNSVVKES